MRALVAAAVLACTLGGCIQSDGTRFDPIPGHQRMSVDSEREVGWQTDQKIQQVMPLVTDLEVLEFVNDLGNELVERLGEQPFDYRFRVLVNPELNAFALPGGYVYLHSGTLLTAGDVEELAGVLAHELGHVKGHHQARLAQETAIPSLLAGLAGMAVGAATGSAAPLLAAQGVNVALQLQYTRQLEDEADRVGAVFLTRAGWSPAGMVRFFERILLEKERGPTDFVPAYLYSHPQIEERITVVRGLSEKLVPTTKPPQLSDRFSQMQGRLAYLIANKRGFASETPPYDRARTDPLLQEAASLRDQRRIDAALARLTDAESLEPNDPRVPAERGDLLMSMGRPADAAIAYRRAVFLDPNAPAILLALGRAHRDAGERREAIFFTEQAVWRSGTRGSLQKQAERQLERLIFPVVAESGFGDSPPRAASTGTAVVVASAPAPTFRAGAGEVAWWGRIGGHYLPYLTYVKLRWTDPSGAVVREGKPRHFQRVYVSDTTPLGKHPAAGTWKLDVLLADDVVHSESFTVTP